MTAFFLIPMTLYLGLILRNTTNGNSVEWQ